MKKLQLILLAVCLVGIPTFAQEYLGNLNKNPYRLNSTSNLYGEHGNPHSSKSANNPFAKNTPKMYDSERNYRGKLGSNPYDSDSISNPFGRYGSPFSADNINNPYGAGSPYKHDSPNNPYREAWAIIGEQRHWSSLIHH